MNKNDNQHLLKQLLHSNPKLSPDDLLKLFFGYKKFVPIKGSYSLWAPTKKLEFIKSNYKKHDKIMLLMSGISAGGKDAVREKIQKLEPKFLFKAVTATTREIRKGEKDKQDYYFYNKNKFLLEANGDKFIEHTLFGGNLYGSPKKSFDDALERSEPVVCSHVEMRDGWPGVEKYFNQEYSRVKPFILKVFVIPNMNFSEYAKIWLPKVRKDYESRLETAAWEISVAASNADIILTNTIIENSSKSLNLEAEDIINIAKKLLK